MKRIHIKGQVVVFPLIIGQRRIGVTIELYKRVYKIPYLFIWRVEDVSAIFMHVNTFTVFAIDITS